MDLELQHAFMLKFAELLGIDVRPFTFSYAELKTATEEFNPANKIGKGGFGPVYKVSSYSTNNIMCVRLGHCLKVSHSM